MDINTLSKFMLLREVELVEEQLEFQPSKKFVIKRLQNFCLREIKNNGCAETREILKDLFWHLNSQL